MAERVAIYSSGEGYTAEPVAEYLMQRNIPGLELAGFIVSNQESRLIDVALELGVPFKVSSPENYPKPNGKVDTKAHGLDTLRCAEELRADVSLLLGWKEKLPDELIASMRLVAGTHPGPLPETAKGYGLVPYAMMLRFAELTGRNEGTEVVIQKLYPERGWDEGPILARRRVPILLDDTSETLQQRGKFHESQLAIEVLRDYARLKDKLPEYDQEARYLREGEEIFLDQADKWAREYADRAA